MVVVGSPEMLIIIRRAAKLYKSSDLCANDGAKNNIQYCQIDFSSKKELL